MGNLWASIVFGFFAWLWYKFGKGWKKNKIEKSGRLDTYDKLSIIPGHRVLLFIAGVICFLNFLLLD
jgi:hypothetical protein